MMVSPHVTLSPTCFKISTTAVLEPAFANPFTVFKVTSVLAGGASGFAGSFSGVGSNGVSGKNSAGTAGSGILISHLASIASDS